MRQGGYLVTRGMTGSATNMIIRGLIPFIEEVAEEIGGKVLGRTKKRKYDKQKEKFYEEYDISVELVAVNGKDLFDPIINKVKQKIKDKNIKVSVQPTNLLIRSPEIKINVKIVEKK